MSHALWTPLLQISTEVVRWCCWCAAPWSFTKDLQLLPLPLPIAITENAQRVHGQLVETRQHAAATPVVVHCAPPLPRHGILSLPGYRKCRERTESEAWLIGHLVQRQVESRKIAVECLSLLVPPLLINVGDEDEDTQVKGVRLLALQWHRLLRDVHCRSGCASARGCRAGLGGAARQRCGCRAETG
jgi:hypothetical protein